MRFGKNVLSQNLRTECDLALLFTLFTPKELETLGLPAPLTSRPGVVYLKEAGIEQETLIFNRLDQALGADCLGVRPDKKDGRWGNQPLKAVLDQLSTCPAVLVQPEFSVDEYREATFFQFGVTPSDFEVMPELAGFVPDVMLIENHAGGFALAATGERTAISPDDARLAISIIDVKHAHEANPSYEAEVVLYAMMLANWLEYEGFSDRFFVSTKLGLWTRAGAAKGALQDAIDDGSKTLTEIIEAVRGEVSPINLPIYVQSIRRFFSDRIPSVVRTGLADWRSLDWHVNPKCASCDWLGFREWLSPKDRQLLDANPDHYCFSRAEVVDHVSRLPLITRGSRRVLAADGISSVAAVAGTSGAEAVYSKHSRLKTDRRAIPGFATALANNETSLDPDRTDGALSRRSDLTLFVTVNFDPGSGLLTGLGLQGIFFQHFAFGQGPQTTEPKKRWRDRFIVEAKDPLAERNSVLAFLQRLAEVFAFVGDAHEDRGGPNAGETTAQIVFWDRRQFDELCLALGRNLPAILYDKDQDRLVRALAWLFPPEELQEKDNIEGQRPQIAFVVDTLRRLVRVPAVHALTLFNVVEHYHFGETPFSPPDEFYREPLSDSIPRERIYEIWSLSASGGTKSIRWGKTLKTLTQLLDGFARTIDSQVFALASVTFRIRKDFGDRLRAEAPTVDLTIPTWSQGVAHDSKLWIAWAKFEDLVARADRFAFFSADPEEAEATHESIRLVEKLADDNGLLRYRVSQESLNSKLKLDGFFCVSVDAVPGFLALPAWKVWKVLNLGDFPTDLMKVVRVSMHDLFGVTLESFNRVAAVAEFALNEFFHLDPRIAEKTELRQIIIDALGEDFDRNLSIVNGLGPNVTVRRLTNILREVRNPTIAVAAPETSEALGIKGQTIKAGTASPTPLARVLWKADVLQSSNPGWFVPQAVVSRAAQFTALNVSQADAVAEAARSQLTIIWGPPGTGKTKTCAALIQGLAAEATVAPRALSVLLTGPNYKAVNELVERVTRQLMLDTATPCRMYHVFSEHREDRFFRLVPTPAHLQVLDTPIEPGVETYEEMIADLASGEGIIIVSAVMHQCARLAQYRGWLAPLFDLVLMDETSQIDMAHAMGPLALLKTDFQLVIAGDHLQMPPVVQTDPPLGAEYLVGSLQTYVTERFKLQEKRKPLLRNYRSNRDIVEYTRGLGYPQELQAEYPDTRLTFIGSVSHSIAELEDVGLPISELWEGALRADRPIVAMTYPDGMAGQANEFEASCVASLVWLWRQTGSPVLSGRNGEVPEAQWTDGLFWTVGVGVVTPHRAQRAQVVLALQKAFPDTDPNLIEGAVDTVERFQGGERQMIVISFGVGDPDVISGEERFLLQLERTNVAISRAMGKCVVFMSDEVANHIPDDRKAAQSAHALRGVADEWCTNRLEGYVHSANGTQRRMTLRWR